MNKIFVSLILLLSTAAFGDQTPSISPVKGKFVKRFGYEMVQGKAKMNSGLDILGDPRGEIVSTADGKIKKLTTKDALTTIVIDHGNNTQTNYYGVAKTKVTKDQIVKKGEAIGRLPEINPNLHYEVRISGQPVDPMNFILDGK